MHANLIFSTAINFARHTNEYYRLIRPPSIEVISKQLYIFNKSSNLELQHINTTHYLITSSLVDKIWVGPGDEASCGAH